MLLSVPSNRYCLSLSLSLLPTMLKRGSEAVAGLSTRRPRSVDHDDQGTLSQNPLSAMDLGRMSSII